MDAPLVAEDCGYEIIDGRLVPVPSAGELHAERHSKVLALLETHVTADFNVACNMLTRTSETTNIAPDASVYPLARDPDTGRRQLEVLAFEVLDTPSLSDTADRARHLAGRGIRRVFVVDVVHERVFEWSATVDHGRLMADTATIGDEAFVVPLPVEALVRAEKADDAMARALLAKGNPVLLAALEKARSEGVQEGLEQGLGEGFEKGRNEGLERALEEGRILLVSVLLDLIQARDITRSAADEARVAAADAKTLMKWIRRAGTADVTSGVFGDGPRAPRRSARAGPV